MTITTLPPELLLRIISYLGYRDLVCARRTCVQWRDLSIDEGLLSTIKERDFREDNWDERTFCLSSEDIGLALFLGRNSNEWI